MDLIDSVSRVCDDTNRQVDEEKTKTAMIRSFFLKDEVFAPRGSSGCGVGDGFRVELL